MARLSFVKIKTIQCKKDALAKNANFEAENRILGKISRQN